jgi:hypothetical protein
MDFAKAFSFVFDDQDWIKKVAIGGLITLIPIIGIFIVMGYALAVARNVIHGKEQAMPEWSDFGKMLVDGFFSWLISMVYTLPIFILMCVVMFPAMLIGGEDSVLGGLAGCCVAVFSIIYGFAMCLFFLPAALMRYAVSGDIMSAFKFGEILALTRANLMVFLMALLIAIVASFVGGLGAIACGVGALFTGFYSYCVMGHAYGQAYLIVSEEAI